MNPTELLTQKNQAWQAYTQEQESVLKREHLKTFKHLNRQYIKATKYRHPWHGVFRTGLRLVVLLLILLAGTFYIARGREWKVVGGLVVAVILGFSVLIGAVLLIKRLIDQSTYSNLVAGAFTVASKMVPTGATGPISVLANEQLPSNKPLPKTLDRIPSPPSKLES